MAKHQEDTNQNLGTKKRGELNVARDTEWYKKRRDEVPLFNLGKPKENPFKHLLKSNEQRHSSSDTASESEVNGPEQGV